MKQIAVFGGGGFIGSHLCRRLIGSYALDIIDIDLEKVSDLRDTPGASFHELDIRDAASDDVTRELIKDADLVIDLIAYANPKQYVDMPLEVVNLNYDMNLQLVEHCVDTDTRLLQFSTCEVYGKVGERTGNAVVFEEEKSDLVMGPVGKHRWIYATAKQLLERMVHAHGLENDLDWTIVRPFNFVGPQMDYIIQEPSEGTPRVFASFMSALLHDHPMYLVDGGTNQRAFTHILDAIDAIEIIIEESTKFHREVVNIGTPRNETTIRDLAAQMADIYQDLSPVATVPEIREVSGAEFYGEGYEDVERRVPNISKLETAGWEPSHGLERTLRDAMSYYIDEYERPAGNPTPSFE